MYLSIYFCSFQQCGKVDPRMASQEKNCEIPGMKFTYLDIYLRRQEECIKCKIYL